MTGAAMTKRIDKIAPPIPLRGFGRIPHKSTGYEVDRIPHDHGGSDVERERQLIGFGLVRCGIDRPQVCANGKRVLARHLRVGGIGHRWVQMSVPAAATVMQRRYEIIVRPGADSGFRVRRNVRPDEGTEGRLQRDAARKRLASRLGMARYAIGCSRKISSALHSV